MAITIRKLPPVLETWFLDEAKAIPSAFIASACPSCGFLGTKIRQLAGPKITAGWAIPVTCPAGENLAAYLAIQFVMNNIGKGRWVIVLAQEEGVIEPEAAMWSYMQSAMAWEVGVVGAVIAGNVRDIDEIQEKLGKEFGLYGWNGSPMRPEWAVNGSVGEPIEMNGIKIRAGDLIVADSDGVVCVPRDQVETTIDKCRGDIIEEVNLLQQVREGHSPIEVLELERILKGNVDIEE